MRTAQNANAMPPAAPSPDSIALSVRSWTTSRVRDAPSAVRSANSGALDSPRASITFETFAQEISNTKATAIECTIATEEAAAHRRRTIGVEHAAATAIDSSGSHTARCGV